ncbi:MAG: hypothetical protein LBQ93_07440 [Treponema sp.]|nr:hypothetical protein [Treponema sp.]
MTDDTEEKKRPNANYKLSKPDTDYNPSEEELVFYYNRERRLAKAPASVKKLYSEKIQRSFNLFRPLVADKPRAILFFTIVVISIMIILFSLLGVFSKYYSLDGNKLEITGTIYEDNTIVVLRKTINKKAINNRSVYTGAVDIAISPAVQREDGQYPVFYHRIYFTLEQEEEYSFVVPFDSPQLAMILQTEKSTLKIKVNLTK